MKNLILVVTLATLLCSACSGVAESLIDPEGYTRRVEAQEATEQKDAFAESQKWLAEGEQAKATQAQADADARAAEAAADADKARSTAYAQFAKAIQEAGKPNNAPVIIAILAIVLLAGWAIWHSRQITIAVINQQPQHMLYPPMQVALLAEQYGLTPRHDGQRWLLVDKDGVVIQRQKLLTG